MSDLSVNLEFLPETVCRSNSRHIKKQMEQDNARKFDRGEHCIQKHLYEHFTLPEQSGFLHDVSVTLIDKTDPSCPTKREDYWIDTLKTKAPMGLNFDFDDSF